MPTNKNGNHNKNKRISFEKKKIKNKPSEDEEIAKVQENYSTIDPKIIKSFEDFPLSWKTLKGLKLSNYKVPTDIQREAVGYGLQGRDILGAAITGSGKTLAFLIPVLEKLFIKKWTRMDGVGAIIISPTRELAYQIFETLKKVGCYHDFSAGLIIGGKNLKFERNRMDQCNIIICTPGRLLQHMDENPHFNVTTMQTLVLDEADRCLDLGFEQTMNAIIENLPSERQTLLFSATQTKSVKDLGRLSLNNPIYVAPHEQQQKNIPNCLQQNYIVINQEDKITMLWSFIKNHLKHKIIVFLASCKQVKYVWEIFCKLRPGTSLLALYGTLHQDRRISIYDEFCRKSNVVLFATDVASRGLDFPNVNWVIQLDCPEDVTQYIHRAGRTARYNAKGENILVLTPSEEESMIDELKSKNIVVNKIGIDPKQLFSPHAKIEAYLAQNKELKESAQRAFISYIKSIYLMKNKKIFDVNQIDLNEFAKSLGLIQPPRVRFLERKKKNANKKSSNQEQNKNDDIKHKEPKLNSDLQLSSENESDEESLFTIKRKDHEIDDENDSDDTSLALGETVMKNSKIKTKTKASLAKRLIRKNIVANKKVVYNDEGEEIADPLKQMQSELAKKYIADENVDNSGGINIEIAKQIIREEDKYDKQRFKELVRAKRKEKKIKIKKSIEEENNDESFDESEDEVDLSWLPDPDKVYGTNENEVTNQSLGKSSKKVFEKKKPISSEYDDESDTDDHSVNEPVTKKAKKMADKLLLDEAEMLAIKLLS